MRGLEPPTFSPRTRRSSQTELHRDINNAMKIKDLTLFEMPYMVDQKAYPNTDGNVRHLSRLTPAGMEEEFSNGRFRIMSKSPTVLHLFDGDKAIGLMYLMNSMRAIPGKQGRTVVDVFILPEYNNQKLGLLMYKHIILNRQEAMVAATAMTPSSRRIYGSLLQDPAIHVYGLTKDGEPKPLFIGPEGITSGNNADDAKISFVAVAK